MATDKIQLLRSQMKGAFIERDGEIDAMLTALIAGEHILFLGPWGTAKSAVANSLSKALGCNSFSILLTKHTNPEEVHGPWDLPLLKKGQYTRITKGRFPEAKVAFLDEIFKSSSALLNGFLTALNERQFDNGGVRQDIPLDFCIGASNELPQDESLGALFDRFLVRRWVNYISDRDSRRTLLLLKGDPTDSITVKITEEELADLQKERGAVDYSGIVEAALDLGEDMAEAGLEISDRRWRKLMKLVQASALLNGRTVATTEDLMPLADAVWDDPQDYAKVYGLVAKVVSPDLQKALVLLDAATELYQKSGCAKSDLTNGEALAQAASTNRELQNICEQMENLDQSGQVVDAAQKVRRMHDSLGRRLQSAVMGNW